MRFSPCFGLGFLALATALVAACSSASTTPSGPTDPTAPPTGTATGTPTGTTTTPTPPPPPNTPDLACLGEATAIEIINGLPRIDASVAGQKGSFLVDLATTTSTIDLSLFPTKPAATDCNPAQLGQTCTFATFEFFGTWAPAYFVTSSHKGGQAGIIGTDFLSAAPFTVDYTKKQMARAKTLCDDATLKSAGLVPLDSKGFYALSISSLEPLSKVVAGAASNITVPNLPTVSIDIAGAKGLVQLDTGFDDAVVPLSINVNEAFFAQIPQGALVRDAGHDLSLSTCAGVSEPVEAYTLATGKAASLATRSFGKAVVFVKRTPPAALKCGGIGTWTVPAAQVGATFMAAYGTWIFDPVSSRVWTTGG